MYLYENVLLFHKKWEDIKMAKVMTLCSALKWKYVFNTVDKSMSRWFELRNISSVMSLNICSDLCRCSGRSMRPLKGGVDILTRKLPGWQWLYETAWYVTV